MSKFQSPVLHELLGYHARRLSLYAIDLFLKGMSKQPQALQLKPVEYSVLALITHNPGITSRQICADLGLLPPNLVGLIQRFEKAGWLRREPHPDDGRAIGLYLSTVGQQHMLKLEDLILQIEHDVGKNLNPKEQSLLKALLQKAYGAKNSPIL